MYIHRKFGKIRTLLLSSASIRHKYAIRDKPNINRTIELTGQRCIMQLLAIRVDSIRIISFPNSMYHKILSILWKDCILSSKIVFQILVIFHISSHSSRVRDYSSIGILRIASNIIIPIMVASTVSTVFVVVSVGYWALRHIHSEVMRVKMNTANIKLCIGKRLFNRLGPGFFPRILIDSFWNINNVFCSTHINFIVHTHISFI